MFPITRRGFGALLLSPVIAPAAVKDVRVISKQPQLYNGWPTVARRTNGDLVLAWSGGREAHVCPFGRVDWMVSHDEGETWSWPRVLMDSDIDDRDAGAVETAKGTLLVTTFTSLAYEPVLLKGRGGNWQSEKLARWESLHARVSAKERKAQLGCWMLRSTDGGLNWSAPYRVPVNSPHGPFALPDGRLLYPGKDLWGAEQRVGICESGDDGQTWQWLTSFPVRSGDTAKEYHELHGVQAADGRIVVHIRNHSPQNHRETLQTESTDGGRTWTTPHATGVWGLPSHLLRLRDGRLLMSYGYRREPFGNHARVSKDNGRTWGDPIFLSQDGHGVDLGYPSTVELKDGSLLSVWYEVLPGSANAVLRQARWKL